MPELPEVETVRQDLQGLTLRSVVLRVEVLLPRTIAYPAVEGFRQGLIGACFTGWQRRGKYLLGSLDSGASLGVHLRMTGQMLWLKGSIPLSAYTRVRFGLEGGWELRFVDQRTFGQMWLVPAGVAPEQVITTLQRLGPEPFSTAFSDEYFQTALERSKRPIKTALLDQTLVAGVGNIYADEALFLSGIHPTTPAFQLSSTAIARLRETLVRVLQAGLAQRGTTLRDYRDLNGLNGNYQGQAWVYGREGDPCRVCGTPIQRLKLAGRSAHFCPHCQPELP
ncbi:DNA-formamidopyrimidine glycosylase [Thermostichus vulcanus]|uniref:Formamidopyrimidine-DNA glycosylase n=1 Tax=Thermostichus vulcanus str. 'Rupite' TaxID=2813851 RepID=A0ABT0C7U1_THEVL|nr:DNA-formamidopyrimidine glycosylase [Thermostichus vulcanus str. 'Rupite']